MNTHSFSSFTQLPNFQLNSDQQCWLAALRSGKFKQHHRSVCNQEKTAFCCLGVADVVVGEVDLQHYNCISAYCLPAVEERLHLDERSAKNSCLPLTSWVADLNDAGLTFPQIADIIEAHWLGKENIADAASRFEV